jgi:anti-sigma28 factor (negative regulator of flagellin synthesis)
MKVDPRLTPDLDSMIEATRLSDRIDGTSTTTQKSGRPAPISDQVDLSPDVQLANAAVAAAEKASDIRPAEVARARELLNSGQLGTDLESLASKIIDSLIK